ncbi:Gamma-D-glutamyl-L-lysine endopeptidase [Roseovarius tolerans]|uniref:Gamma-D-glutamyl-L-lysine endopeptidase n=1 Tax=Roseovarius tolerans TaxID=74031 RepID=A0A0L6CR67_9RHOB|nr:NlpC/P60 family protein [Roseovarius tolerans]KNX40257.1 Gamma-D-glutamyl-L-lysine endopeptidase [Roseovarius tolerans]
MTATRLIDWPLVDLRRAPEGARDRQLLMGEAVQLVGIKGAWAEVSALRDGYPGYIPEAALTSGTVTHRVSARATHAYSAADFKSPERVSLSHGARLDVLSEQGRFAETPQGYVPRAHLVPLDQRETDPVSVAEILIGTPYLWGGNSAFGIDCSGLVQAGCLACGLPCPGDSGDQEGALGETLPEGAALRRGDLLFWRGHVAWVADPDTLIHANVHHMAVTYEPVQDAISRIAAQGDGPVTARKRLKGLT